MNTSDVDLDAIRNCVNTIRGVRIVLAIERDRLRGTEPGRSLSVAITELETGGLWIGRAFEQIATLQATPVEGE